MTTMTTAQLSELMTALTTMTSVLTEVAMTPEASVPAKPVAKAAPKAGTKSRKAAPKGRKGGSKSRTYVRTVNLGRFSEAIGDSLEGWVLTDVLDALRGNGQVGDLVLGDDGVVEGMPEGWAFGPASVRYLRTGSFDG